MSKKNEAEIQQPAGFSVSNFFKGIKEELDKVVWPSRQQLVSESAAVLSMVALSASLIYVIDWLFNLAATKLFLHN